eukprot:5493833-Pyramimonas_sp.AAC.1
MEPGRIQAMKDRVRSMAWPPSYNTHPVVVSAPEGALVIPLGIFVDVARYGGSASAGRQRGILVMSISNLATQKRYPGVIFRKQLACKC